MKNFVKYADVYDLLYSDKDYQSETHYVTNLILQYGRNVATLLDLGCGTGRHSVNFSKNKYRLVGVDRSFQNILLAKKRTIDKNQLTNPPQFFVGDLVNFSLNKTFDAAVALFHVLSYISETDQLIRVLQNIRKHIKNSGLFIFDCWYGPAVLNQKPETRVKTVESDCIKVIRISEPQLQINRNVVDVNFHIHTIEKSTSVLNSFNEIHSMRYFFHSEIIHLLQSNGFELIHFCEWMTGTALSENTWNALYIARAI